MRDDERPTSVPGPEHADGPLDGDPGDPDAGRDGFDVPEWVSEFRRLYVEPKTRAVVRQEAHRRGRKAATPTGGAAVGAQGAGGEGPRSDSAGRPLPPAVTQPLSDEPLRSRSELQRSRRAAAEGRPSRGDRPAADPPAPAETGPGTASRAALRRAREERVRAERRMRLRRTVVVGVLILAVAVVVTWLVARSREPVAASASTAALVLAPSSPVAAAVAFRTGPTATAGDASRVPVAAVGGGVGPAVRASVAPSSAVSQSAEPTPSATPEPPARGTGRLSWVDWGDVPGARTSGGHVVRVALEVEGGIGVSRAETASTVSGILVGDRGWQEERDVRFVFVGPAEARRGAYDLRIALASRLTTMELCGPVQTKGFTSCYNGRVVLNLDRWVLAVPAYAEHLDAYRTYVVNHEVGHSFGLGHDGCPRKGQPASVMVPQTLHLWGCLPNPYPVVD